MKYIHGFRVNTENAVRYCTRMPEEKGETLLRRLTESSQFEEAWVYLPSIREWGEIGINEANDLVDEKDPRYTKRSVDLDGNGVETVAKKFKEFTIYHTHALKRRVDSNVLFYHPQCSLPSYEDFLINLRILAFYDQLNQGHSIRFKSVSPLGVTEVKFSKYARDHFQEVVAEKDSIKADLSRFESSDFTTPLRLLTFRGNIEIIYKPLAKARVTR